MESATMAAEMVRSVVVVVVEEMNNIKGAGGMKERQYRESGGGGENSKQAGSMCNGRSSARRRWVCAWKWEEMEGGCRVRASERAKETPAKSPGDDSITAPADE
jgi:hypothetical protein